MYRLRVALISIFTALALITSQLLANPAHATNTTPSTIYFPATASSGSSCAGASGQRFVDASNNPLNQNSPGLIASNGYQVTVTNNCPGTIYIYYGQSTAFESLGTTQTGTYTIVNNAAIVSAYSASTIGSASLLAAIYTRQPPDVTTTGSNASTTISPTSISTAVNSTFIIQNDGSDSLAVSGDTGSIKAGGQSCSVHLTTSPCAINAGSNKVFTVFAQGTIRVGSTTLTVGSGGGGGSASSAASGSELVTLSLTPEDGTTCSNSAQVGTQGTWVSLPDANDCTPPASKAGAKLLGWATSPNFPVAIANRQVDNGWGAYETFDESGQLTGVFIPAGGATFLSAGGSSTQSGANETPST